MRSIVSLMKYYARSACIVQGVRMKKSFLTESSEEIAGKFRMQSVHIGHNECV